MKRDLAKVFEDFIKNAEDMNFRIKTDTETWRKTRARIKVTLNGIPAEGAKIHFEQKSHEFKFGANCFMLDELENDEKNARYKELFAEAFNLATVPFYWNTLEPEKGKPRYRADSPKIYRRPAPDLCVDFCEKNNIEPKLHCLNYDAFAPDWYTSQPLPEQRRLLEKRMRDIAERYADKIPDIEVTNEHQWSVECSSPMYLWENNVEWSFKTAEKYFPNNNLIINDGPDQTWWLANKPIERQGYYLLIKQALEHGARIDKIGMQYHIWDYKPDLYENTRVIFDPVCLYREMDTYGKLVPELQVTEITLPASGAEKEDEEYQAELLEKLYRIWFSHKNMQAIIYWNLVDGYAFGAKQGDMSAGENRYYGGLLNFDMSPKVAYKKLLKLMREEWHTSADCVCDIGGNTDFRGFYGGYDVKIIYDGKEYKKEIFLSKYTKNDITVKL